MVKLQNFISKMSLPPFQKQQMFFKVGVLKSYAIFTGKHLRWSLFLIKFQSFRSATLLKRDSNKGVFLWTFKKFLRTAFFIEHVRRLLLPVTSTFRNYYWEELLVIFLTLSHPSKWLNTCFKGDNRKCRSSRVKSV